DYLFCDASHFAMMHPGARAEPVLAAWGSTTAGKPVLLGLDAAANEGNDACDDFLDGLTGRGLRPPLLVISDGAASLVGGRCNRTQLAAFAAPTLSDPPRRQFLAKVPRHAQAEVKSAYWALFDVPADVAP